MWAAREIHSKNRYIASNNSRCLLNRQQLQSQLANGAEKKKNEKRKPIFQPTQHDKSFDRTISSMSAHNFAATATANYLYVVRTALIILSIASTISI